MTDFNLRAELHDSLSARQPSGRVWAIRRKADGLYFEDVMCMFFPLHPLALFESSSRAEGRVSVYLDEDERAGCEIVEFTLTEVTSDENAR